MTPGPNAAQYSVARLLELQFADEAWWLPDFIPKSGLVVMGGPSKVGKSWLLGTLTRALTLRKTFLEPEPGYGSINFTSKDGTLFAAPTPREDCRVLLVDKELGERTLQSRLNSIFHADLDSNRTATLNRLEDYYFYTTRPKRNEVALSLTEHVGLERLRRIIHETAPHVILLDPINMMHQYDENDNSEIQKLINTLQKIQDELVGLNTTIIYAHHFKKGPNNAGKKGSDYDPLDIQNFRGASKFGDVADALILMDRLPSDTANKFQWDIQLRVEGRHGPGTNRLHLGVNYNRDGRIYFRKVLD